MALKMDKDLKKLMKKYDFKLEKVGKHTHGMVQMVL